MQDAHLSFHILKSVGCTHSRISRSSASTRRAPEAIVPCLTDVKTAGDIGAATFERRSAATARGEVAEQKSGFELWHLRCTVEKIGE